MIVNQEVRSDLLPAPALFLALLKARKGKVKMAIGQAHLKPIPGKAKKI